MDKREQAKKAIKDYFKPVVNDNYLGRTHQMILANKFKLKHALINMCKQNQFGGVEIWLNKQPN